MSHIPPEVLDLLASMRETALTVAGLALSAIVALHSMKFLLRSLSDWSVRRTFR